MTGANNNGIIAIDGPSGTGKSTVARAVASRLGIDYLDTGALYRIVTLHVLQAGIDPDDDAAVAGSLDGLDFTVPTDPDRQRHELRGTDITARIRNEDVTAAVSAVSANPAVRAFLLDRQRTVAYSGRIVIEGRDIGTVIAPDAAVKIYLTADAAVRARRRHRQHAGALRAARQADRDAGGHTGQRATGQPDEQQVAASLQRRDTYDAARAASPLLQADDALVIDSTGLTIDETVEAVLTAAAAKGIS